MKIIDQKKAAIYYQEATIDYKELIHNCYAFTKLTSIQPKQKIGILSENRPEWLYAFYGTWLKESVVIPIDFMSNSQEIQYILEDAKISEVFTSASCQEKLQEALQESQQKITVYVMEDLSAQLQKDSEQKKEYPLSMEFKETDETAVMIYTSGTTGKPKGVMLTYKNLGSNAESIWQMGVFRHDDVYGGLLPFHHIYPLMSSIIMPFYNHSTIALIEKLNSESIMHTFQTHKVTILFGIPRVYTLFHQGIMSKINANFLAKSLFKVAQKIPSMKIRKKIFGKIHRGFGNHVRYFLSGGSKIDQQIMVDFGVLGFQLCEGYGLSETSPMCAANNYSGIFKSGSIGKAIDGVEIKIVDNEICVRGDNVMKGYYNRPQETAEVLKDGWFYTGDEGYFDKEGFLVIQGRKRDLIVLPNGKKVNPEEVEWEVLKINPEMIKEIGVFAKGNGLFAVIHPNFEFMAENNLSNTFENIRWKIIDTYNRQARDYRKILDFQLVAEEFPKTRIGKVKRYLLPQMLEKKEKQSKEKVEEPKEKNYKILKDFLQQLSTIEVQPDSYLEMDLNFDSLARIETQSFIEGTFGVEILPEELSGDTTVLKLYERLQWQQDDAVKNISDESSERWKAVLNEDKKFSLKGNAFFTHLTKIVLMPMFLFYIRIRTKGKKQIPKVASLLTPNHQSFLDSLLLIMSLPHAFLTKTYFIAHEKHFSSKIRKFYARYSNIQILDINNNLKDSLQRIAFLLKKGKNVVIFPEGARTRDGNLMEFKKFFAILSKELQIPVVPVTINGANRSLPVDTLFPKPGNISLTFSAPISPDNKSYNEITKEVHQVIANLLR